MNQPIGNNQNQATAGKSGLSNRSLLLRIGAFVAALVAIQVIFTVTGLNQYFSLEALKANYQSLQAYVSDHFWVAIFSFVACYIAATALSLPGATLLSLFGGFLFGLWAGVVAVLTGATIGAAIIFLIAKTIMGEALRARASGAIKKMEEGFRENAFSYLLILRLIPLFPFFIVNIVPSFLGVNLRTFVVATFIGIIPGVFAFVSAGAGLGAVLEQGEDISLSGLLTKPEILTPIIALSVLAIIPVAYKAFNRNKTGNIQEQ